METPETESGVGSEKIGALTYSELENLKFGVGVEKTWKSGVGVRKTKTMESESGVRIWSLNLDSESRVRTERTEQWSRESDSPKLRP